MSFGLSIFLSAFLLFIIQPLISKQLLPAFGGASHVWLGNILFFQGVLLLGYLYSFTLTKISNLRHQVKMHLALLCLSFLSFPIMPKVGNAPSLLSPLQILIVLATTIGLPAVLISASSPLFQFWHNHCFKSAFPYRYYALSNFGSLLGLLAFPFLLEPYLGLKIQFTLWSILYLVFCLCTLSCFALVKKLPLLKGEPPKSPLFKSQILSWLLLAFLSNALLLSVTQIMTQSIMSFPLLWVVPLSLYLITYILTFAAKRKPWQTLWCTLFLVAFAVVLTVSSQHQFLLSFQIFIFSLLLFSGCMVLHGELVKRQPAQSHLPAFYLSLAAGGVLGGIFINIIAPLLFTQNWDFYLVLFSVALFIGLTILQVETKQFKHHFLTLSWCFSFIGLSILFGKHLNSAQKDVIYHHRNFFGVMEIAQVPASSYRDATRSLRHGHITHGMQFTEISKSKLPTSYYSEGSGIGHAVAFKRQQNETQTVNYAVIGLGTGTTAALSQKGDCLDFYEIDPDIVRLAKNYFTFLKEAPAKINILQGDGRLTLEQRLQTFGSAQYDVIAVDAFNGDAIPLHLVTLEALQIYQKHLNDNGILAFHISSRYLDLYPPLQALASKLALNAYVVHQSQDLKKGISASEWVLLSKDKSLGAYLFQKHALLFKTERTDEIWTDDKSNLLAMIRW